MIINAVKYEILKGNITVKAVVCRESDRYCKKKDGFEVIAGNDIHNFYFDYLVIVSSRYYNDMYKEAIELGINEKRILNGAIFKQPLKDLFGNKKVEIG